MNKNTHKKLALLLSLLLFQAAAVLGQEPSKVTTTPSGIRIGERLTYNISFQRYNDVGYFETYAVSRGKLGDVDAVELRMKLKTSGLLSAAFYQIDEARTTFASPETGSPLFIRRRDNSGVETHEVASSYLTAPAQGFDLLTLLYKARTSGGIGSFVLSEGDKNYGVTLQSLTGEHVKTDAGEFDTTISTVQSDYILENGIQTLRINFSNDDAHIPVLIRLKTAKGEVRIALSGMQMIEPETEATATPTPAATPRATPTPIVVSTPPPYVDNQPLSPDVGFDLGERLVYRVSAGQRAVGEFAVEAKERKQINKEDSLILTASVTSAEPGNGLFAQGDSILALVSPETLAPFAINIKFSGSLTRLNQSTRFDQRSGAVTSGPDRIDAPIGTHCILSLFYAIRSFNLTPSKDPRNPINDTRVAVYWEGKPHIFILRPSETETITVNGVKINAQRVSINTGIPEIDAAGLKVWLTNDDDRVPVQITFGQYKAELLSKGRIPLK